METQAQRFTACQHPSQSAPWRGLYVLLLAGFVTIFDLFVVNVAIPSMQSGLNASFSQIGFIVAGYELAFGVLLITGSRLGDMFGRRRLFIVGMAGFTLASIFCGLAPSANILIGARVLQGLAAALLFPQVYALIRVNFVGDDSRRAFGLLGMTLGLAAIAAQVFSGWMVHGNFFDLGWRSIFLINVPIGLLAIITARWIPESRAANRADLDWCGVSLVSIGLSLLLIPLIKGPEQGWPDWTLWSLVGAVLMLVAFYYQQEHQRNANRLPLVDMRLLLQKRFTLGTLLVLLVYSTSSSFFLSFALLVQTGFGLDPLLAGSIFAPCSVGFVVASLVTPKLITKWGEKVIVVGALIYAVSIGLLIVQVYAAGAELEAVLLIPVLLIIGFGQGAIMTPLLNLVLGFVDEQQAGMASGVVSTVQQVGAAFGVAVIGILFSTALSVSNDSGELASQYSSAFVTGMLYNFAAAVMVCLLLMKLLAAKHLGCLRL
ncbi:MFS transporter [Shewanella sp. C32]|uniref:MFS transporter n=1 Tax=Shewanella electrica TaxID=515560 RepID=A0ABT2FGI4_9GAMM|nr:MFS transporter [Shewanella electrica]MCH1923335.1 MFS transporter [Shewanella electrica]MCS4555432.1 MFS transporter [Shewanella electrica]